jgi:hypothetical protein
MNLIDRIGEIEIEADLSTMLTAAVCLGLFVVVTLTIVLCWIL